MDEEGLSDRVDAHLGAALRLDLEERLWRPIGARATLEAMVADPAFLADPGRYPAMFADHGVVHARDVATGVLRIIDVADGVLLPGRSRERRAFMEALGVATAYLHDVGMVDLTHTGRRVHAIAGAHAAFGPDADPLVARLLERGPVRERLDAVAAAVPFAVPPELVVRELLSLCVLHSKTSVPASAFTDREALRRLLQRIVYTPLDAHRRLPAPPGLDTGSPVVREPGSAHPETPDLAYAWLVARDGPQRWLADDTIDAMRVLRAADVLRQRGTVLRTSGGFEVCMDAVSARAVCTMRPAGGGAAFVVTYDDPRGAGEANLAEAIVTRRGDLRLAVHRGAFSAPGANELAVASVADVVVDIAADVLPAFDDPTTGEGLVPPSVPARGMVVHLERPADRPEFAEEVARAVAALDPGLAGRLGTVSDTHTADGPERDRYLAGDPVDTGVDAADVLARVAERGAHIGHLDPASAFGEVVLARLRAGETLLRRGSPPSFVYLPLGDGLVVIPDGGYAPSPLPPWVPVGTTGVIRGAERNSDIVAEHAVDVLAIPAECYARTWLRPIGVGELARRLADLAPASSGAPPG